MTETSPTPPLRSLVGRTITVDPFPGGPRSLHVDTEVLLGPFTDLWKATDEEGKVWGLRMLPQKEVHPQAWKQVLRIGGCDHPHIARIMGRVWVDGVPGLVREWVEGQPLDALWQPNAPIFQVEEVFRSILDAIRIAHRHNVVHGGLKPSRVLVDFDSGSIRVLDFATGPWLPPRPEDGPWLAPERRETFEPDERSDIYALGAMLYWLATGVAPERTPVPVRQLRPDLPEGLRRAIEGAMCADREQRIPSCKLLQELVGMYPKKGESGGAESFPSLDAADGPPVTEERTVEQVWPESKSGAPLRTPPTEERRVRQVNPRPEEPPPAAAEEAPMAQPDGVDPPPEVGTVSPAWEAAAVVLFLLVVGAVGGWAWFHNATPNEVGSVRPAAPNPPPPPTVNTVFEFAGSTQPDSVVVSCAQLQYQAEEPVVHGRAVVGTIPAGGGCTMYPAGVTVQAAWPVVQGHEYHCIIDRAVLNCAGTGSTPSH